MRHETVIFGRKNKTRNSSYHLFFFAFFFLFQQQKTQKCAKNPVFIVFSKPKKDNFQMLNLHRKLKKKKKNQFLHPLFEKGYF